jgi:uncharacterized surface protein with fasciclin (FAS1) repeats
MPTRAADTSAALVVLEKQQQNQSCGKNIASGETLLSDLPLLAMIARTGIDKWERSASADRWKLLEGRTMSKFTIRAAAMASVFALGAFAAHAENPMVGGAAMFEDKNIVENAMNSQDHTTLVAAVKAAGLVETLQGAGPFTVFAPTNAAFEALPAGTVDTLLKPENKEQLTKVLTCHVVSANAMSDAIGKMIADDNGDHPVKTVGGCTLSAKMDGDKITLTDETGGVATVTVADVKQSNGVIHVIDKVLLPKS